MKLVWTKRARFRLEEILDYIEDEFGKIARDEFRARAKEFTQLLVEFPELGSVEAREKGIRGFQLVSKQGCSTKSEKTGLPP